MVVGRNVETIRSRRAWEMARRQYGVVARRDLLALGFSSRGIEHRVATGRLHPAMRGVYSVGWPAWDRRQRWMAAVLACDPWACLSHSSAGALWGVVSERPGVVDVSIRRHCNVRRPRIHIRVRCRLG